MKLMSLGLILTALGVSTADSDSLWLPFVLVLTGALCMFIGQNFIALDEEEDEKWTSH